jgi:hypothetical protein
VEDFPDNVIVVGSVAAGPPSPLGTVAMASSSSPGDMVEIAAPGDGVSVLVPGAGGGPGRVVTGSGTSFAAPMVAGVAGLLLSFDPTIPVDQLKALILEGALTDGFSAVPQLPVLHAYGALKAAARRTGAPVCGNTVVADGTQILVDRGDRWDGIGNSSVPGFSLAVQHGSRAIDVAMPVDPENPFPSYERVEFASGKWSVTPAPAPDPENPFPPAGPSDPGGFAQSQAGQSHDGLTAAEEHRVFGSPVDRPEWQIVLRIAGVAKEVYRHHQSLDAAEDTVCTRKYVARDPDTGEIILTYCNRMARVPRGEVAEATVSMAPLGGRIYLTVVISNVSYSFGGWAPCGFEVECPAETSTVSSLRSTVHEIDIAEETAREVFQVPHAIYRLGVSEDGKDIVFGRYDASSTRTSTSITRNWSRCTVEVRDARSGNLRRTAPFERSCFLGGGGPFDVPALSFGHGS